ncbi:hypothetical protein, partial [Nocardia wallacei]|uniref:hypothetical protein n=1 Tax=Nocardia wallacei TaxID=480035 RepID=UPI002455ED46
MLAHWRFRPHGGECRADCGRAFAVPVCVLAHRVSWSLDGLVAGRMARGQVLTVPILASAGRFHPA